MEHAKVAERAATKSVSKVPLSEPAAPPVPAHLPALAPSPEADPGSFGIGADPASYTVVARRYRPQNFDQVVGQDHVVRALRNAIRMNRIAQAYVFSGTRGVGKTSIARIFAKCLNCVKGPTENPCQVCDICQAIASGQDVDVIEIDGASNNGVEQVRELRQNASLRPSRCRYKIYYIDEVHMLSTNAFNALLKTLEEPPAHVKFFFATTEPGKIPITVLSRCQRYDFAGITPEVITKALAEICSREGIEADTDALQIVARRATGSLRDAQSLLDRLLSSGIPKLTVEAIHSLLGTASDERLLGLLGALSSRDAATALELLETASKEGVQPVELLDGVLDFLRDAMVLAVKADSALLAVTPKQKPQLKSIVDGWTLDAILAAMQILAECRSRLRGSAHGRLLVEMALVKVARLEDLTSLGTLLEKLTELESGPPHSPRLEGAGPKKKLTTAEPAAIPVSEPARPRLPRAEPAETTEAPPLASDAGSTPAETVRPELPPLHDDAGPETTPKRAPPRRGANATATSDAEIAAPEPRTSRGPDPHSPLEVDSIRKLWPELIMKLGPTLKWKATQVEPVSIIGSDILVIAAKPGYNQFDDDCSSPESLESIRHGLQKLLHRTLSVHYERSQAPRVAEHANLEGPRQRTDRLMSDPLVNKVIELFEAKPHQLDFDEKGDGEYD
jgi:DNA polymerase-3 subunit gamma/tau